MEDCGWNPAALFDCFGGLSPHRWREDTGSVPFHPKTNRQKFYGRYKNKKLHRINYKFEIPNKSFWDLF